MSSCLATYLFVRPSTLGRPSFGFSDVPARRPIRRQPTSPSFRAAFSCVLFRGPNRTLPREAGHSPSPASRTASDRPIRLRSTSPSPRGAGWWTSRTRPCLRRARVFERVNPRVDPSEDSPPGDFPPSDPGDEATTPPRRAIPPSPRNPHRNVQRSGGEERVPRRRALWDPGRVFDSNPQAKAVSGQGQPDQKGAGMPGCDTGIEDPLLPSRGSRPWVKLRVNLEVDGGRSVHRRAIFTRRTCRRRLRSCQAREERDPAVESQRCRTSCKTRKDCGKIGVRTGRERRRNARSEGGGREAYR